jgi:hypothetical protein
LYEATRDDLIFADDGFGVSTFVRFPITLPRYADVPVEHTLAVHVFVSLVEAVTLVEFACDTYPMSFAADTPQESFRKAMTYLTTREGQELALLADCNVGSAAVALFAKLQNEQVDYP